MIVFKCDGCGKESDYYHKSKNNDEIIPANWLSMTGVTINNELPSPALFYAGRVNYHFCSQRCLMSRLFKEEDKLKGEI